LLAGGNEKNKVMEVYQSQTYFSGGINSPNFQTVSHLKTSFKPFQEEEAFFSLE
jgi:hypothetical protein